VPLVADDKNNIYLDDLTPRAVRAFPGEVQIILAKNCARGVAIAFSGKRYVLHARTDAIVVPAGENLAISLLRDPHDTTAYATLHCVPHGSGSRTDRTAITAVR
jgi:hypothetical protein